VLHVETAAGWHIHPRACSGWPHDWQGMPMVLRTVAVTLGGAGAALGLGFIVLSVPDARGWDTWDGRFALAGLGASSVVGLVGAFLAWRRPLVGALAFWFAGAALITLPLVPSPLLFMAAGLCLIDAFRDRRRAGR